MFALLDLSEDSGGISLKCDPELAIELREQHPEVTPAYHFNKAQWNSVYFTGSIPTDLVCELMGHSYELVVQGLKRADREALEYGSY